MKVSTSASAIAVLGIGSLARAQVAKSCPSTDLCYSLNIPDDTASSGSGDVYFQLSAPSSYQWVALGQGTSMTGANIFVMYTDSTGSNVTLSPRLGTGQVEPKFDSAASVTLLAGSGVANGVMTANVRCSNCNSWSGGSMDFTSSSTNWIWAEKQGSALDSDSTSADIVQHDNMGTLSFQSSAAKGGSSVNPFVSDTTSSGSSSSASAASSVAATTCVSSSGSSSATLASPSGSGCPTTWPTQYSTSWPTTRPTEYASCYPSSYGQQSWPTYAPMVKRDTCETGTTGSSSSDSSSSGTDGAGSSSSGSTYGSSFADQGVPFGGNYKKGDAVMMAHGIMAALAFVIFMPIGGIVIRVLSFPGLVWLHAALQTLGYLLYIAAFGLGIYLATQIHELNAAHPIIGIVIFIFLFFQPIFGLLHHALFKKYQKRVFYSYAHIWLGRIIITLAIINGGLGIQLAGNVQRSVKISYAVVAAIMWSAYVAAAIIGERRRRSVGGQSSPPGYSKGMRLDDLSDASSNRRASQAGRSGLFA